MQTILYIHGFRSSAQSKKARLLAAGLDGLRADWEYICPDLSHDPNEAMTLLTRMVERVPSHGLTLVGSSLGGFYAWVLAERFGCRAVLLNPSLAPADTLSPYLGELQNLNSGERFEFLQVHLDTLKALRPATVTAPPRYLLVVEMGDQLLDHRRSITAFAGAAQIVIEGGSHDLDSFPRHIPAVLKFAGLLPAA